MDLPPWLCSLSHVGNPSHIGCSKSNLLLEQYESSRISQEMMSTSQAVSTMIVPKMLQRANQYDEVEASVAGSEKTTNDPARSNPKDNPRDHQGGKWTDPSRPF
ncbi:hypothetical protein BHM03_00062621 [Ensete ventricosum]|nr:hypothetical protein BHM03_00062621 [Ensete ventricosum]